MKSELKEIHQTVNDWLKFAEAKHGALIAINSVVLTNAISNDFNKVIDKQCLVWLIFIPAFISLFFSFLSFIPRRHERIKSIKHLRKPTEEVNLYYSRDVSGLELKELEELINSMYINYSFDKQDKMIINQIYRNSVISTLKYNYFIYSVYALAVSLFCLLIIILTNTHCA